MSLRLVPPKDEEAAYVVAVRLLNYRFRAEAELRRKLRDKEFASDVIEATDARLRRQGSLDEAGIAVQYARALLRKRKGRRRIAMELREFGVDDEVARGAIAEAGEEHPEEEAIDALLAKKAAALERKLGPGFLDDEAARKKLAAYLFSQGYDAPAVFSALDRYRRRERRN